MKRPLLFSPMRFPTPEAQFEEMCMALEATFMMLVVVWPDDVRRAEEMKKQAKACYGIYFECKKYATREELLIDIAKTLSIDASGKTCELIQRLESYFEHERTTIFFDHADRLAVKQFRGLRRFYDLAKTRMVFGSSSPEVIAMADDTDQGGAFKTRCLFLEVGQ